MNFVYVNNLIESVKRKIPSFVSLFMAFWFPNTTTYIQFTCNKIRKRNLWRNLWLSFPSPACIKHFEKKKIFSPSLNPSFSVLYLEFTCIQTHKLAENRKTNRKVENKFLTAHLGVICPIFGRDDIPTYTIVHKWNLFNTKNKIKFFFSFLRLLIWILSASTF